MLDLAKGLAATHTQVRTSLTNTNDIATLAYRINLRAHRDFTITTSVVSKQRESGHAAGTDTIILEMDPLSEPPVKLVRQVGLFDATMMVMGGIVGAGIFMNPYVVARQVHSPVLILSVWIAGGVIALFGAFVYAELGDRKPNVGGPYAYLRDAYHPAVGFLYGWVLLLVIQTGGMAAATVIFARYFLELTHLSLSERTVGTLTVAALTLINCLGVKFGSRVQSALMLLRIVAIAGLIVTGLASAHVSHPLLRPILDRTPGFDLLTAIGASMVPILFAFGGWQTANFIGSELKDPRRNLSRALLMGVAGVVLLYLGVNIVCVRVLGPRGLADTTAPATTVMRLALGNRGAMLIAAGIAISTLGFLSQSILTGPRVYFAMAQDGLFFQGASRISRRTRVPIVAIVLQSAWTIVVMLTGRYEQILNYVVSMDFLFLGLTATCLFVLRKRERRSGSTREPCEKVPGFRVPGHPFTTAIFIAASWLIVADIFYKYPANTLVGFLILLAGFPAYAFWRSRQKLEESS